jgi:23S rRNA (adenine2503-C2)-methyltransferase
VAYGEYPVRDAKVLDGHAHRPDLRDLALDELRPALEALDEPAWRAKQIFAWLYKRDAASIEEFTDLPKALRTKLADRFALTNLEPYGRQQGRDRTEKLLFRLADGQFVETVLLPAGKRATVCLSTQVGCKFRCAFCASGRHGLKRHLRTSEMLGQVLALKRKLEADLTNFVFMGMGEPLDNFEAVERAIRIMNLPEGLGVGARRITVSTAGHAPGIERLAALDLQISLSLSLHAATDRLRDSLMPINQKWPLERVMQACETYLASGGRMMTLEYVLLEDVNDSSDDAEGLAGVARRLRAKVNLIPYSPVPGLAFRTPGEERIELFRGRLEVTVRRSKGQDILAACGQLAGKSRDTGERSC